MAIFQKDSKEFTKGAKMTPKGLYRYLIQCHLGPAQTHFTIDGQACYAIRGRIPDHLFRQAVELGWLKKRGGRWYLTLPRSINEVEGIPAGRGNG